MAEVNLKDVLGSIYEAQCNDGLCVNDGDYGRFDEDLMNSSDDLQTIPYWGDSRFERSTKF